MHEEAPSRSMCPQADGADSDAAGADEGQTPDGFTGEWPEQSWPALTSGPTRTPQPPPKGLQTDPEEGAASPGPNPQARHPSTAPRGQRQGRGERSEWGAHSWPRRTVCAAEVGPAGRLQEHATATCRRGEALPPRERQVPVLGRGSAQALRASQRLGQREWSHTCENRNRCQTPACARPQLRPQQRHAASPPAGAGRNRRGRPHVGCLAGP